MIATKCSVPALLIVLALLGCRAKPAPDAGFLKQPQLMKKEKEIPFNRIYLSSKHQEKDSTEIYTAPVNLDHMMKENAWEMASEAQLLPDDVRKNVHMLADYTRDAFIKAVENDPNHRFKRVQNPGPNT